MSKIDNLMRRYAKAKSNSDLWQVVWDEAYSYIFPDRNLFKKVLPGERKNSFLIDNTAQIAASRFVSQMHNGLTPLFSNWAILKAGEDVPKAQAPDIERGLQQITDIMFSFLNTSNFNLVINEAYQDLVFGTGAFLCLEGQDDEHPLVFRYVPMQDLHLEPTQTGELNNVFRTFKKVPIRDLEILWPGAKVNDELQRMMSERSGATINLIESTTFDEKSKIFTYSVIDKSHLDIIFELESPSSPWIIFRWMKIRGETFGRGPGIIALPTIKSLNLIGEYELETAELNAGPIYVAWDDTVFNPWTVKIRPRSIIPIAPNPGGGSPIQALPPSGQVQFTQLVMSDLRDQVNKIFFADPLGPVGDPKMTATEVNLRNQQTLEEKAPAIARLQVELGAKLIKRVLFILRKRGLVPNIEINDKQVRIEYLSELATLEGLKKVNALTQVAQTLQAIVGPQITLGAFKMPNLPEEVAEDLNAPLEMINSPEEIESAIEKQQQQAAAQQPQLPTPPQGGLPQQSSAPLPTQS